MDYKRLIELLRNRDNWDILYIYANSAADAIEDLLAEREAAEEDQAIYRAALDKWGALIQTVVAIEEMAELQKELCKSLRGIGDTAHIAEELADTQIMGKQMTMLYDVQEAVLDWKKRKLERLAGRVNGEDDGA